jgi:hypothetical protein
MTANKKVLKKDDKKKNSIIKVYADLHEGLQRSPTMDELTSKGKFTKDSLKHHFSSLGKLESIARDTFPDKFFDVKIEDLLSQKAIKELRSQIKKHKKFVVTTAVTGCSVDDNFYQSIKLYCKTNNALLLILVSSDPAHMKSVGGYGSTDSKLTNECIVFEDTELNSNLFLSTIKLSAKHIDPITGLDRIGQRDGSFIFASPKQRLHMVPTSNIKLPHALMTTGAITKPNYNTDMYMSERTAYIANHDHIMGAIVLEVKNNDEYHFRQVQADVNGSFVDLGKRYTLDKITDDAPEAIVLGDWHSGENDPTVTLCTEQMLKQLKPKNVILHDAFNGLSVNHHEDESQILKAKRAVKGLLSLENEIEQLAKDIEWFTSLVSGQVVMVKSNHDEFLCKHYLQHGKYTIDPHNHYYAVCLAKAMLEGADPLKFAVENKFKNPKGFTSLKVLWLQRDDDFLIKDIQLGAHGDKGPNGSRGSLRGMEKAYGNSVSGHSHTPGILRGAWAVGTSSLLKLSYNSGPSSWLQTHCLVYSDGSRQLINIINGKWKL